ncbi:MAG: hypothetical protein H7267_10595 [Sandarakinorhabdus sp.]|nr:hypothetical protein [Sandarakinorhabdus sp.]
MHIKTVPAPAAAIIAICGKCGKKLGGGFGPTGETSLGKALSLALGLPKPKRANVRIVETKCLKLCPKGAVAVLDGHDPGHILMVPAGTPMATLVHRLGLHANG